MALLGRDNNEDINYTELTPLTTESADDSLEDVLIHSASDITVSTTKKSKDGILKAEKEAVPEEEAAIISMDRGECMNRIGTLSDEVEALFKMPEKFDITSFSSEANIVMSEMDMQEEGPSKFVQGENQVYSEDDYKSHRRDSFPHIHHPLKALHSRSFKSITQLEPPELPLPKPKKKKKKKKKKKEKVPAEKRFPSKSAIMAPTIPEVDNEEYEEEESSESEADSEDFLDGKEKEVEEEGEDQEESSGGEEEEDENKDVGFYIGAESRKQSIDDAVALYTGMGDQDSQKQIVEPKQVPSVKRKRSADGKIGFYIGDERENSPYSEKSDVRIRTGSITSDDLIDVTSTDTMRSYDHTHLSPRDALPGGGSSKSVLSSVGDPGSKVKFSVGGDSRTGTADQPLSDETAETNDTSAPVTHSRSESKIHKHKHHHHHHRHHHHHHRDHYREEDLKFRRKRGSEVNLKEIEHLKRVPTEVDEAKMLHNADLDDMTSHRFEDVRGLRRHKITKYSAMASVVHISKTEKKKKVEKKRKIDHKPHDVFVELDELYVGESHDIEWREKARWIKFEEDVEEGAERWGKPHVASLSFHSLLELRRGLENGTMLLDLDATDLASIFNHVIDSMIIHDQLKPEHKGNVLRTLLLKHRHVGDRVNGFIRRNISYMNLMGLDKNRHQRDKLSLAKSFSTASFRTVNSQASLNDRRMSDQLLNSKSNHLVENNNKNKKDMKKSAKLDFVKVDVENNMQTDGVHIGISQAAAESRQKNIQDIRRRMASDAEASVVLVGCVDYLEQPVMAFVRLAEGQMLDNVTEVPLPVRFLFILLGPEKSGMDYHEVGRSISTLMSNQHFHDVAYRAESRAELLHAINEFLNESIVLPPGDWDQKTLLPIMDMARKRAGIRRRKKQKEDEKLALIKKEEKDKVPLDPLKRTRRPFGGLINDIRRRYPYYLSDFKDALNGQCVAAFVFIYFACFAPAIAFGALLGEKTHDYMGVTETVLSTSLCGVVFGLFSGQPLMLIGPTGPVLVFEQSLFKFCKSNDIEFLTMRVWIGFWVMVISVLAVALESSFLVRYITRFTEEVFAILISLIFIFEVIKKLQETFAEHPLMPNYCLDIPSANESFTDLGNDTWSKNTSSSSSSNFTDPVYTGYSIPNATDMSVHKGIYSDSKKSHEVVNQPNTALLSTILTLGTFLLAYFLRIFRNSKFLGRSARRALGDFGIVISIIVMVLVDFSISDIYTQKLSITDEFQPTAPKKRGWFIHPMGTHKKFETYLIFASFIPGFLIFALLFLEFQITEMILNKKEMKLHKGSGYHLDQLISGILTFVCALFGLPWMCAATVRTIAHFSALSVMSRTHAPGEKPRLQEVKDQRVTSILMNAMIGVSLAWGPLLRAVPIPVLFGVFLYLGFSALSGVQMFKRIKLLFIPVKHHPSYGYVRGVKTLKMHLFTVIQIVLLVLLLIIKSTAASLAFPLFVILLIPLRLKIMPYIFNEKELSLLDKEEEESDIEEDYDPDFYQIAHMPV